MLEKAHQQRAKGIDVVLGLVETQGRAETADKVGDLEVIARRAIEYRGTGENHHRPHASAIVAALAAQRRIGTPMAKDLDLEIVDDQALQESKP